MPLLTVPSLQLTRQYVPWILPIPASALQVKGSKGDGGEGRYRYKEGIRQMFLPKPHNKFSQYKYKLFHVKEDERQTSGNE